MSTSRTAPRNEHTPSTLSPEEADRAYRHAWWSLALFPASFALTFVVGEGILSLLTDGTEPAVWQILLAAVPAVLVFVLPALVTVQLGRRARRLGRPDGLVPAIVGGSIAVGFVVLNIASFVLVLLVD